MSFPFSLLARAWRWTYPPIEDRVPLQGLNSLRLLVPYLFFVLDAHFLLRHSEKPGINLVRRFILFPLTCAVAIHCYLGSVIPGAQHPPGPSGSISWGKRPFGGAETFSLSQAEHFALGTAAFIFIFRAADLCFSCRPPALNKDRMALHDSLQSSAKEDRNKEEQVVEVLEATSSAPSEVIANGLRHRKSPPPPYNPVDKTKATIERDTDTPLLIYLPSTRIPLEVDLGLSSRAFGWTTGAPYAPGTEPVNLLPPPHSKAFHSLQARRRQIIVSGIQFGLLSLLIADVADSLLKMPFLWGPRANIGAPASLGGIREVGFKYEELEVWQRVALTLLIGGVVPSNTQGTFSMFVSMMLLPAYLFPTSTFIAHYTYADPSHWEPIRIFGRPWHPGSVRKLWGKEWHQMLTCIFKNTVIWPMEQILDRIGCGVDLPPKVESHSDTRKGVEKSTSTFLKSWRGRPGKKLRRALITLSVFLVSGLFHEGGFLAMARTPRERDFRRIIGRGEGILIYNPQNKEEVLHDRGGRSVLFFFMQGVGCVLEDVVETLSGGRFKVQGIWGSAWALFWFFLWGSVVAEPALRQGMAQSVASMRLTGVPIQILARRFASS
ncbi:hypothetical protein A4X13_0g6908 [Tilletia indica]|uniref:Wax synthase domain-containing protein n=1 Tax=Tilletia indica TaxID=43049 RepID=A0A177T3Y2_9BASI|nr:hypothetical protein A4X13_0g6908 [Tilletia indica]